MSRPWDSNMLGLSFMRCHAGALRNLVPLPPAWCNMNEIKLQTADGVAVFDDLAVRLLSRTQLS